MTKKKIDESLAALKAEVETLSYAVAATYMKMDTLASGVNECTKYARETFWAEVFKSSIAECDWLRDVAFFPAGWAAGYQFLYVLYRILEEKRPKSILDIGLGQTSKMIAKYAARNPDVRHIVVEESEQWMKFFGARNQLPKNTEFVWLEYAMAEVQGASSPVRVYNGFKKALEGLTFDLVLIDAPFAGDMKELARVDVLDIIPDGIAESYAILVDDTNRKGELRMLDMLVEKLQKSGRSASAAKYSGRNDCHIVVSDDNVYLKSL